MWFLSRSYQQSIVRWRCSIGFIFSFIYIQCIFLRQYVIFHNGGLRAACIYHLVLWRLPTFGNRGRLNMHLSLCLEERTEGSCGLFFLLLHTWPVSNIDRRDDVLRLSSICGIHSSLSRNTMSEIYMNSGTIHFYLWSIFTLHSCWYLIFYYHDLLSGIMGFSHGTSW